MDTASVFVLHLECFAQVRISAPPLALYAILHMNGVSNGQRVGSWTGPASPEEVMPCYGVGSSAESVINLEPSGFDYPDAAAHRMDKQVE